MRIAIKKTTTKNPHKIEIRHYNNHNEEVIGKKSDSNCLRLKEIIISNKDFENKKYPKEWPSEGMLIGGWYDDGKHKLIPLSGIILDGIHPSMGSKTKPEIQLFSGKKSIKLIWVQYAYTEPNLKNKTPMIVKFGKHIRPQNFYHISNMP